MTDVLTLMRAACVGGTLIDTDILETAADELERLRAVERAARHFVKTGIRLTPDGAIIKERQDKLDPYCALCRTLDRIEPLNATAP